MQQLFNDKSILFTRDVATKFFMEGKTQMKKRLISFLKKREEGGIVRYFGAGQKSALDINFYIGYDLKTLKIQIMLFKSFENLIFDFFAKRILL